jgi:hypothetical protein
VLVEGSSAAYTDYAPCRRDIEEWFCERSDKQIMGLELLAVLVGIFTFMRGFAGKLVRVWEDNAGAEGSLAKGSSKEIDHNAIVHAAWLLAAENDFGLWFERVSSERNIADLPSREDYRMLREIGARWVQPIVFKELPCQRFR